MEEFLRNLNWELVVTSILAACAIGISVYSLHTQRKHNKLTFRPIPVIVTYNYISVIRVMLWNKGNGPLLIKSLKATKGIEEKKNLIGLMPKIQSGLRYVDFIRDFKDRALSPNDSLNLLEFKIRCDNENGKSMAEYEIALKTIKDKLNQTIIEIEYTDIYNEVINQKYIKKLDFGVTFDEENSRHDKL